MQSERPLLFFGGFSRRQRSELSLAAKQSAFHPNIVEDPEVAVRWVAEHEPHAIVVETGQLSEQLAL